jgi:hypothetical protein
VVQATPGSESYDADPDGDGINEAVYLDLDYPVQTRDNPDGSTTKYVPLFAFTVLDADGLLNLNAGGNLAGTVNAFTNPFGLQVVGFGPDGVPGTADDVYDLRYISRSNQGVGVSQVNPQWGLTANPAGETLDQHQQFFGHAPADFGELANMEWFFLLSGRPQLDTGGAIENLHPGRYGEVALLDEAVRNGTAPVNFPSAGLSYKVNNLGAPPSAPGYPLGDVSDDDYTAQTGGTYRDINGRVFPPTITFPAWRHPLDLHGSGLDRVRPLVPGPADRYLRRFGQHRFPAYAFYQNNPEIGLLQNLGGDLLPGYFARYHVDEPEETILEPSLIRSDLDSVFGAGESPALHLPQTVQDNLALSSRLQSLAPVNFAGQNTAETEARRSRFTPISFDVKTFSKPAYDPFVQVDPRFRTWEFTDTTVPPDGIGDVFPPRFPNALPSEPNIPRGRDPFRPVLRRLLSVDTNDPLSTLQRRLSINHVLDHANAGVSPDPMDPTQTVPNPLGELRFRPLTPHPGFAGTPAMDGLPVNSNSAFSNVLQSITVERRAEVQLNPRNINSLYDQEFLARRDRQQLCRDIYVMLYTFCSRTPSDPSDLTRTLANTPWTDLHPSAVMGRDAETLPSDPLNTPVELLEMAQFAVNLVDRLDPDDVVTKFEFDIDLSNGWNLDDDPATDEVGDRRVVFGVEEQQLTLHEAQVVYSPRIVETNAMGLEEGKDHNGTHWNEEIHNDFTYIELENVGPVDVEFNANKAWQIVVKPDDTDSSVATAMEERRLTFLPNAPSVRSGANSRLLIAATGEENFTTSTFRFPQVMAAPNYDPANPPDINSEMAFARLVPAKRIPGGSDVFDLLNSPVNQYQIQKSKSPSQPVPKFDYALDGDEVDPTMVNRPSTDLLVLRSPADADDAIQEAHDRQIKVRFLLRRRLNPHRGAPTDDDGAADNPWITVDELEVPVDIFALSNESATRNEIQQQITGRNPTVMDPSQPGGAYDDSLKSTERTEPLAGRQTVFPPTEASNPHRHYVNDDAPTDPPVFFPRNSLGFENPDADGQPVPRYNLYQTHFNRDFSSIGELLNIPLYGPQDLTRRFAATGTFQLDQSQLAASRFRNQPATNNFYWYRLFEFIEVP